MTEKGMSKKSDQGLPTKIVEYFFPLTPEAQPAIVKIANVLRNQGVATTHLCQAMAIIIGILSPRLGDPVPMIITEDEGAGALELLQACLNLVPEDSWVEKSAGTGSKGVELDFEGKTLICYEADTAKDLLSRLLTETELRSKIVQTKRQSIVKEPTAFVALTKNPRNPLLQNRYVTRIHIPADEQSKTNRLESLIRKSDLDSQRQHKIESACLRTLLSRIKANPVDIDFADKIIAKDASKLQNAVPYVDSMFRILRNITRINNSPQLHPEELQAAFIGLDFEDLTAIDTAKDNEPLKPTKVDYHYFLMIYSDMFNINNDFLTDRQLNIYHVILDQSYAYQRRFRTNRKFTPQQILDLYQSKGAGFSNGWATRANILANLKTIGYENISYGTLHNELQVLLKRELIGEKKVPHKKNEFGYAATRFIDDASLFVTNPVDIDDPKSKKEVVEVFNFLSGKTEKI
ncbi:MAG: hypothetical protein ACQ9MH_17090 [Nitrospinales bacterium]